MATDMNRAKAAAATYATIAAALRKIVRADDSVDGVARNQCRAAHEAAARALMIDIMGCVGVYAERINVWNNDIIAMAEHVVNTLIDAADGEIDHMADARRRGAAGGARESFVRHYVEMMTGKPQYGWSAE